MCPLWTARHKSSKDDVDAISITAWEEDMNELLWTSSKPGATTDAQMDVNDELLSELSAGPIDDEKKGPKVTKQLAVIVNKRWAKKLAPEKITSILEKYSPPENCSEVTATRVNTEIWAPLTAAEESRSPHGKPSTNFSKSNVCYGYDNRQTLGHEK